MRETISVTNFILSRCGKVQSQPKIYFPDVGNHLRDQVCTFPIRKEFHPSHKWGGNSTDAP